MDLTTLRPRNLSFRTERLSIRVMNKHDYPSFSALQSDPQLMAYIGEVLEPEALKAKFEARAKCFNDHSQWFTLLIFERATSAFCGSVGFLLQDIANQKAEIGYVLLNEYHGKGMITEAAQPMIDFLFNTLKVKKITAHCAVENTASWKVMEKLSLQREGLLAADFCIGDTWYDSYSYGLINADSDTANKEASLLMAETNAQESELTKGLVEETE